MLRLFRTLRTKDWLSLVLCAGLIVFQVWLDLKMPEYLERMLQIIREKSGTVGAVAEQGAYMLLCAVGSFSSAVAVGFLAARTASHFGAALREKLFDKTLSFSMEETGKFSTASLITRTTNDITQVQMVLTMGLQVMIKAPVLAIWAMFKIGGKSIAWTALTASAITVLIALILILVLVALPKFRIIQKLTDNLNRETRESLTGLRVVRAYNAEGFQEQKFGKANSALTQTYLFTTRIMAVMMPVMTLVMSGLSLGVYWIGAHLIEAAAAKGLVFSDMMVFSSYAMQLVMAFMMMAMIFIILPRATVSAKRINEVLRTNESITDGEITGGIPGRSGEVEFVNVSFKYPDAQEYILRNISFSAKRGETVAFIGSTGSGKSTLINLVPRFYDATEGEILIDGVNIRDYKLESLRNKMGYVPQRAVIFGGTIASNVDFGSGRGEKTEEDIADAISAAQAEEFVSKSEGGINAPISQGGANISGGQKQRLAIARAIARKPEIFIFDDSFSALDFKTDRALRRELSRKTREATKLIVAQRIGTIIDADKIIVLDKGEVTGQGTHTELMESCPVYQEIAYSQLSKKELN